MRQSFNSDRPTLSLTTRLILSLGLFALCGCQDGAEQVADALKSQAQAKDALQAQGAGISKKQLPALGSAIVIDFTAAKEVSDETFRLLKQMGVKQLMEVNLSGTNVTDAQLAKLTDPDVSEWLASLNLRDTHISDAGLGEVSKLPILFELNVVNTKITPEGVNAFFKAREENPAVKSKKTTVKK